MSEFGLVTGAGAKFLGKTTNGDAATIGANIHRISDVSSNAVPRSYVQRHLALFDESENGMVLDAEYHPCHGWRNKEGGEVSVELCDAYRYVLISPCRNEAVYMRHTLDSVLSQSVLPAKWVIVDDGSTDDTPTILAQYAAEYEWIEVLTRANRGHRAVGPGVIDAFYAGYDTIDPRDYNFLCKLDLDLRLPVRYFEILMSRMISDPRIATCSGKAYIEQHGRLVYERHGDDTSLGMTKFYRARCFEAIGGFVHEVMWDGIDCHRCRMKGWIACSWNDPELRFVHLRPMGSSQMSTCAGRMRHGFGQYFMGTGFAYMAVSAFSRLNQRPYVIGGLAMLLGWLRSAVRLRPRYADTEFRSFLRSYQRRLLLMGKSRALRKWESETIGSRRGSEES